MASKEVKKQFIKMMMQGVLCFQISLGFITTLATFFFILAVRYPSTKIVLLHGTPLPHANFSCTVSGSFNDLNAVVSPPSLAPVNAPLPFWGFKKLPFSDDKGEMEKRVGFHQNNCDLFDGRWVEDRESRPFYQAGSCPFVEEAFNCFKNGRPDLNYTRLRWKPKACSLPRFEGRKLLDMLKGKRLAFVGDSLNRNMWESLVCILRNSLRNKKRVFDITGKKEFKYENSYAFKFIDYNCTIEFFRAPFLVQEWERLAANGTPKESLRLDLMDKTSTLYKEADVIVFNSAHWWTHDKTSKGEHFYQEGDYVHRKLSAGEAYHKALTTWAHWIDENINPNRTSVFFRGYSWTHFKGGQWNSGGNCDGETLPIVNDRYLAKYPNMLKILESVMLRMRTHVLYLNITRMTDYRKEAHPSLYRFPLEKQQWSGKNQDCSHWCLPGVPDTWNELMYAMLLQRLKR